jgi:hypothetical protein
MVNVSDTFLLACAMPTLETVEKPVKSTIFARRAFLGNCRLENFGTMNCANARRALARLAQA